MHTEGRLEAIPLVITNDCRTINHLVISRKNGAGTLMFSYLGPTPDASLGHEVLIDSESPSPSEPKWVNGFEEKGRIWRMYDDSLKREYLSK